MSYIALVDCNNFYVSCERVFQPYLKNKPVIVLSNNDGCVVSRSSEVKKLAIPMGIAVFKIRHLISQHHIQVFSSNYCLYGDLSRRVMNTLKYYSSEVEIYSIDEAFLRLSRWENLHQYGSQIRTNLKKWTGIPTSIGIAPTKVLAKVATKIAKKSASGVFFLKTATQADEFLKDMVVEDIWGIGKQLKKWFHQRGIITALDFKQAPVSLIEQKMGIVGKRLRYELEGISCLPLELIANDKKQTCVSRSFAQPITSLSELQTAIALFVTKAATKLYHQRQLATVMIVFARSSLFIDEPHSSSQVIKLLSGTNYTPVLLKLAKEAVKKMFQVDCLYKKAGVIMTGLHSDNEYQINLFEQNTDREKEVQLMDLVEQLNKKWGAGTINFGLIKSQSSWRINSQRRSPRFTTQWADIPIVKAGTIFM